ncbi:D-alanine--D-alanine ligase family protein [Texcoconibacillus texcoconensis]|nr:D-alanine--D-alanine ligase [Texcoconibacillus texcoconensis]
MKVAVLYGGTSAERQVSLATGKGIIDALQERQHEVVDIDFQGSRSCIEKVANLDVDVVFIGLHGRLGEDGKVQAILDMIGIPYVGSGVFASALAMNKHRSKHFFAKEGIRTAKEHVVDRNTYDSDQFDTDLSFPIVVKPNQEGSTIGLTIAKDEETLKKGIAEALKYDKSALLEEFVSGHEVTVAVMGEKYQEQALPVVEIVPKNAYYDYESKYAPGGSEHYVPARISESLTKQLQEQAVSAHRALGCDGYSRVDFILPSEGGAPVILEVNTLPGMTPTSLYPDAARAVGLSYSDMVEKLLNMASHDGEANK